jgi:hypothetical protein
MAKGIVRMETRTLENAVVKIEFIILPPIANLLPILKFDIFNKHKTETKDS